MKKDRSVIVTWPVNPDNDIMVIKHVTVLGMKLTRFSYMSCVAHFGVGGDWATLSDISSLHEGKGHAQVLLNHAKCYYEKQGMIFGSTVALSPAMKHILNKLGITEYSE